MKINILSNAGGKKKIQNYFQSDSTKTMTKRNEDHFTTQDNSHIPQSPENSLGTSGENIKNPGSQQKPHNQPNASQQQNARKCTRPVLKYKFRELSEGVNPGHNLNLILSL